MLPARKELTATKMRDRIYWLIAIATGLVEAGVWAVLSGRDTPYRDIVIALDVVSPALFGGVFSLCVWRTIGMTWWRGLCLAGSFVAAQKVGYFLAITYPGLFRGLGEDGDLVAYIHWLAPFVYGAVFALIVCVIAAILIPAARNAKIVVRAVMTCGLVAMVFWPLWKLLPGWLEPSAEVLGTTFGLVYAALAASWGGHLLQKRRGKPL